MDTAPEILRDSNAEKLAILSANTHWNCFRIMLRDVEMVIAARDFIPEGHSVKAGLQGHIYRFVALTLSACQQCRGLESSRMFCADQMRLVNLFGTLKALPQARAQIKKILDEEIRNDASQMNKLKGIPGCRDPHAHRNLLNIFSALRPGDFENSAVEDAIIKAFISHNPEARQQRETNESHGGASLSIRDKDDVQGHEAWYVKVKTIKVGKATFEEVSIKLTNRPEMGILELRIQEAPSAEDYTKLELDTTDYYTVRHCPTKRQISLALDRSSQVEPSIIDVCMYATEEGETLIEKLNVLGLLCK